MSSYTDFLPSSKPIGSVHPKFSDKQLYTAPNGEVWVRNGDQILAGSSYPDAIKSKAFVNVTTALGTALAGDQAKALCWDGTHWVVLGASTIYKYNTSGSQVGSTISISGYNGFDITWDGTHYYILSANGVVRKYTQAGVYANVTWNTGHAIDNQMYGIEYISTNDTFYLSGEISNKIYYFKGDGTRGDAAAVPYTVGGWYDVARTQTSRALASYGGLVYSLTEAGIMETYPMSISPHEYPNKSASFDVAAATGTNASSWTGLAFSEDKMIAIRDKDAFQFNAPDYVGSSQNPVILDYVPHPYVRIK